MAHRSPGLTIHSSRDDTVTGDQGTMIDTGLWVMGSMVELESDVVLYAHWDTYSSLMRIQRFRVGPAGLEPLR